MRIVVQDKYYLRDILREIDLYDRKLLHLLKHETFATDALRDSAVRKLSLKRDALAETAKGLVASGMEYAESELPRSFRPEGYVAPEHDSAATPAAAATAVSTLNGTLTKMPRTAFGAEIDKLQQQQKRSAEESPLASALGSWQDDLVAYKKKRHKPATA